MNRSLNRGKLDAYLARSLFGYDLPGLAVAVGLGKEEYRYAAGWQNALRQTPLSTEHIFHMASISKTLVGTAILQLAERGSLSIEDPLLLHLPDFRMADARYRDITLRHLLSHTAGLPDVTDYAWDRPEIDAGALERYVFSEAVTQARLLWPPGGDRFAYSNIGYEVLGLVVARVSGMSFENWIHRHIFEPTGMRRASMLTFERDMTEVAAPHYKTADRRFAVYAHFPYNRAHAPSSTLTADLDDMACWAHSNLKQTLLESDTYGEARSEQATIPNNGEQICLSWFRREQSGCTFYGHEGTDDGFRASFWFCPEWDYYSVVCSNLSDAPVKKIARELFDLTAD